MIAYLKGTLEEIGSDYIVVDVNNIGYQVRVSLRVMEGLPGLGSDIKIHTYTYVREDVIALYGFLTKDDLQMSKPKKEDGGSYTEYCENFIDLSLG